VNILFIHDDPLIQDEIDDFLTQYEGKVFFSKHTHDAIRILQNCSIDLVVLKLDNMHDAAILKYINDYYKDLEVVVMASKEYDDIISVFTHGHFKMLQQPVKLVEIKKNIENIIQFRMATGKGS
jgi:DNA-binding NtrC family response regulator